MRENGRKKGAFALVLASLLLLCAGVPVKAAPYTYRVRIHAGAQGKFSEGSPVREYLGDESGTVKVSVENWEDEIVVPEDSKYYVKGIRRSGTEEMGTASFTVSEDVDYVVVYGVKRDLVGYTVTYRDESGRELAPEKRYQGNVGDTPIVGYLPIDGYQPKNAFNLTRTLQENEAENIFPFVYEAVERPVREGGSSTREEVVERTETQTVVVPGAGEAAAGGAVPAQGEGAEAEESPEGAETGGADGDGAEAVEGPEEAVEGSEAEGPRELVNLDDEEVPLAGPWAGEKDPGVSAGAAGGMGLSGMPYGAAAGLMSAVVLSAAGIYYLVMKRKGKAEKEKEE